MSDKPKKVLFVEIKMIVPVEVDDDPDFDYEFHIEDNGCPATREVGGMLSDIIEVFDEQHRCWACAMQGENKIVTPSPEVQEILLGILDVVNKAKQEAA